jgi:hypothetical protein
LAALLADSASADRTPLGAVVEFAVDLVLLALVGAALVAVGCVGEDSFVALGTDAG